ncbi:MAG: PqqD family protein [Bacteroidales bacterium]|nr:PqqD family protein [Bacteroidales bacterium]
MRIKEGFVLRSLCGEFIVVGEGLSQVNFNKMLSLNASAAYLWESVSGKDFTVEDLAKLLTDKYEVTFAQALEDAGKVAAVWIREGVAEEA